MTALLELKDKVQRWLTDAGINGITLTQDGYSFRVGSTRLLLDFEERGEADKKRTLIKVICPFLQKTKPSPELYQTIVEHNEDYLFGHFVMYGPTEDGDVIIAIKHVLLGDYVDPDELLTAAIGIAVSAGEIDKEWVSRFGGETFYDED